MLIVEYNVTINLIKERKSMTLKDEIESIEKQTEEIINIREDINNIFNNLEV